MNSVQQKLYTKTFLVIFTLLCNVSCVYAMENSTDFSKETIPAFGPEHSLRNQCARYIGTYANEVSLHDNDGKKISGLISNLPHIPADLASDIVLNLQYPYLAEHKDTLISLVHESTLDHAVSSSIAYALCKYKKKTKNSTICVRSLIHAIAKRGDLSWNLAKSLVSDFANVYIPDNFDELYNDYFPMDILQNKNNEQRLFCFLSNRSLCYLSQSDVPFTVEEFQNQISATVKILKDSCLLEVTYDGDKKYKKFIPQPKHCNKILAAYISPDRNILLLNYDANIANRVLVINMDTLVSMNIDYPKVNGLKRIGLNSDYSLVGIADDNITHLFPLPAELITLSCSFQQMALVYYIKEWFFSIRNSLVKDGRSDFRDDIKKYAKISSDRIFTLITLIQMNESLIPNLFIRGFNVVSFLKNFIEKYLYFVHTAHQLDISMEKIDSHEITQQQVDNILANAEYIKVMSSLANNEYTLQICVNTIKSLPRVKMISSYL